MERDNRMRQHGSIMINGQIGIVDKIKQHNSVHMH